MKNYISKKAIEQAHISIRKIATENGVSEEEVRREMMKAMKEGMSNPNPEVQALWNSIPWRNGEPSVEEFIAWNTEQLRKKRNR